MPDPQHGAVKLRELVSSRDLAGLEHLHIASTTSPVRDVALVTDVEEVSNVGPDTIVVLTQDVARGGWMISAALRYAWERRACALVVPEHSFTSTVVELARRLGISLFTTGADMTRVSLDIALQLGVIRAGSLARLQAFHERLASARNLPEALELVSEELDGAAVSVENDAHATRSESHDRHEPVAVPLLPSGSAASTGPKMPAAPGSSAEILVARVRDHAVAAAEQVLAMATPTVRALLLESQLGAIRASLPLVSFAALAGAAPQHGLDPFELQHSAEALEVPLAEGWVAVCLIGDARDRAGHAVHRLWNELFPRTPLAAMREGWAGFVPAPGDEDGTAIAARLRRATEAHPVLGRSLGLGCGLSRRHRGAAESTAGLREAWYAARLADPARPETAVVGFDAIPLRLLARALPAAHAEQIVESLLPRLMEDPARPDLVAALLAYLEHHGSATAAAAALGVHRNTLQSRLRRAQELGVPLDDPELTLPLHMLLAALRRG